MIARHIPHPPAIKDGKLASPISIGEIVRLIIASQQFVVEPLARVTNR